MSKDTGAQSKYVPPAVQCDDCLEWKSYHEWLLLRCTLDNEDTMRTYCKPCFLKRMMRYVEKQTHQMARLKADLAGVSGYIQGMKEKGATSEDYDSLLNVLFNLSQAKE